MVCFGGSPELQHYVESTYPGAAIIRTLISDHSSGNRLCGLASMIDHVITMLRCKSVIIIGNHLGLPADNITSSLHRDVVFKLVRLEADYSVISKGCVGCLTTCIDPFYSAAQKEMQKKAIGTHKRDNNSILRISLPGVHWAITGGEIHECNYLLDNMVAARLAGAKMFYWGTNRASIKSDLEFKSLHTELEELMKELTLSTEIAFSRRPELVGMPVGMMHAPYHNLQDKANTLVGPRAINPVLPGNIAGSKKKNKVAA